MLNPSGCCRPSYAASKPPDTGSSSSSPRSSAPDGWRTPKTSAPCSATASPAFADRYQPAAPPRPGLIAGLIPRAQGAMNPDDHAGLDEREALIEQRAQAVLDRARDHQEPWLTRLPNPRSTQQVESLRVIAAYRDRWRITGADPLGPDPDNDAQRLDYRRTSAHLEILRTGADEPDAHTPAAPNTGRDAPQR